ncbi:type I polyketide synthase [Cribrihabitans pelagius]|uniref:type I polyketide synthase n=1 Tax=Cribrihabitans pelagius TaxID=1765746 RepID=UPI003B5A5BFB
MSEQTDIPAGRGRGGAGAGPGGNSGGDIAIVGIAADVPGASSAGVFWRNLREGIESIEHLDRDALLAAGERPDLLSDPNYVPATARMQGFDEFDAEFFGFSPKEAAILDPQHRKFLEAAWGAMENAGHPPENIKGPIGVYAGCGMGSYFYFNLCSNPALVEDVGMFLLRHTGNDKDFLSTRVSHVFGLTGPSVNIQTACSTSLVAVHYACKALREGECDMALAGGVTIELPQGRGYVYKENEILSPDGHCHAFDHRAQGTVFGSGAGAVALRRLEDAVADGDHIWAVIKGSAVNNDGSDKAGYLAPSVSGQAKAVRQALEAAGTPAESIGYVECHGTGTYLGDPIEMAALTEAYRATTTGTGFCRIGSVKTNIGHLDTAAGVAGLAKTALALHHKEIPPSLGFEAPNPAIDFDSSPFRVNASLTPWQTGDSPRRAGVNALGVGGTNAHVILEEAPARLPSQESDFPFQILCLSGHSKAALEDNTQALAAWLRANPEADLADVAFTLKEGRRGFAKRRVLVAESVEAAARMLEDSDPRQVFSHEVLGGAPEVVFMFPGGGAQYAGMARDLYETEPVFAEWMDRGLEHLQKSLDYDIRAVWLPEPGEETAAEARLKQPSVQLPLIMIAEFALAQLWMSWGVKPAALVGHSMGENTAACLAGVMAFEDCIDLVLLRGRLFDSVPAGGMLSVALPVAEVEALLGEDLDIASVNAPELTAVSGPDGALERLAAELTARGIEHQRIAIDIAAHSHMLDGILDDYRAFLAGLDLHAPGLPVISNRSGAPLTAEEAVSPDYWTAQLRHRVLFGACIGTLSQAPGRVFLEVGPGNALSALARMAPAVQPGQVLSSLRHPDHRVMDDVHFFGVIGRLWACGVTADWDQIWGGARRHRLPLPGYAFQRSRYFIEPGKPAAEAPSAPARLERLDDWGYRPVWRPRLADCPLDVAEELGEAPLTWLIFKDDAGHAARAAGHLEAAGHRVARVHAGDTYARLAPGSYVLPPEQGRPAYAALLNDLAEDGLLPDRIGHFWLVTEGEHFRPGSSFFDRNLEMGYHALLALAQELGSIELPGPVHISLFTTGAVQVREEPLPSPEKAMAAALARVIPRELPNVTCAAVDIELPHPEAGLLPFLRKSQPEDITPRLLEELLAEPACSSAAWRGGKRFELDWRKLELPEPQADAQPFREGGHYLITGGYGGIGLTIAEHLMRAHGAKVTLLAREGLPPRESWDRILQNHGPGSRQARRIGAVKALEGLGRGAVMPLAADVCNSGGLAAAKQAAEAEFGPVTGVIHAAGVIADGPLLAKTEAEVEQVFAPKISGLRALEEVFPDGRLEVMVLFSSTSAVTCPAGQADYAAANEYLNAYARHRAGGRTKVVAVDWGVWADTGMAAEALEGRAGAASLPAPEPCAQPLLRQRGFDLAGNRLYTPRFDAGTDWLLDEHRTRQGTAVMPGTGYIELAAEALSDLGGTAPFEIRDLYFLKPMVAPGDAALEAVLRLEAVENGYELSVYSKLPDGYAYNCQAMLAIAAVAERPAALNLNEIAARCPQVSRPEAGRLRSPQEDHLNFGPRWHVLERCALGDGEGLAALSLPAAAAGDGAVLHPGLMDLATGWAMELIPGYDRSALWVPVSYDCIRVFAPLGDEIRSHVRLMEAESGAARFDVTLTAPDGAVLVEITGFAMQRLAGGIEAGRSAVAADASAAGLGLEPGARSKPLSPGERRLQANIANGIRAAEGGPALERALAAGLPQVVVSSLDLPALIEQAATGTPAQDDSAQSFERPQLDTGYVAPRNPVEEELAALFASLLGVSQAGVEDSFFDLGGHSLIAVRLFAQINRSFGVDFPLSLLFEAPSVAALAERIIARTGGRVTASTDPAGTDPAGTDPAGTAAQDRGGARPDHTHLVQLHAGDGTGRRPFFLVAGMFGNVLNLRHLALLVGRDRPVYGLQAKGLTGGETPHDRIEDAAASCLEEIRGIQPEGPYLLGGFSGGGITAYEMAQQLKAAGQETAALILLDTPLPRRPGLSRRDKALIKLAELRRKGAGYFGEWAQSRLAWEIAKRRAEPAEGGAPASFNNRGVELAFRAAVAAYDLKPWEGPMTLFRPALDRHWQVSDGQWVSRAREYVFDDNGWRRWAPAVEVAEVPGDHDSMVLVPNVSVLAAGVKARLDAADAEHRAAKRSGMVRAAE